MNRKTWKLYIDGSSLGNPGEGGCAFVLVQGDNEVVREGSYYLGIVTNNEAEYYGLIKGLNEAIKIGVDEIEIVTDSELLYKQLLGKYKVKAKNLRPLHAKARELLSKIRWKVRWVERGGNKRADSLARKAAKGGGKNGKVHN